MESETKTFIIYITSITTSLTYTYYISSKIPKGIYRFLSLTPIFYLFTILPLHFSFVFTTALTASFTTWLTNFKLIRFAFDLHPSPFHPSYSLFQFILFASLPIKPSKTDDQLICRQSYLYLSQTGKNKSSVKPPKTDDQLICRQSYLYLSQTEKNKLSVEPPKVNDTQSSHDQEERLLPEKNSSFLFKFFIHITIFAILANMILNYRDNFSKHIILVIYCVMLFLIIDIISVSISVLFFLSTGLELEKPSNDPYLATSLQDFWARWNLMVTNTLRHTIYKPVRIGLSGYKWAPLAGVMTSFIVSGLMHELFVYQLAREVPTWEMMWFFVLHGICVVVEMVVRRVVRWRLPEFVATVLTVGFVVVTGFWLFFPPLVRSGVDVKILQEYMSVVEFVKDKLFVLF